MAELKVADIEELKKSLKGNVILPENADYDEARKIWNAMIDKHPALIAQCTSTADVVAAVNFARDKGLLLAVRGGEKRYCKYLWRASIKLW